MKFKFKKGKLKAKPGYFHIEWDKKKKRYRVYQFSLYYGSASSIKKAKRILKYAYKNQGQWRD